MKRIIIGWAIVLLLAIACDVGGGNGGGNSGGNEPVIVVTAAPAAPTEAPVEGVPLRDVPDDVDPAQPVRLEPMPTPVR